MNEPGCVPVKLYETFWLGSWALGFSTSAEVHYMWFVLNKFILDFVTYN
jgi:hypothetical protein